MSNRSKNPRAMLVSFSGIDGAGKSTQITNLSARLEESGLNLKVITFWDDVATLKSFREDVGHKVFKGDKGVGTPEAPIHRRDKNVRSPWMTVLRLAIYVSDAISLRRVSHGILRSEADVVIFDRFLFDELANLDLANPAVRFYLRTVIKLVPRPDVSFVLDADPEQAFARKPEYPLDFLHSNRNSYLALSRLLEDIVVIPPMPIARAKEEVVRHVFQHPAFHARHAVQGSR